MMLLRKAIIRQFPDTTGGEANKLVVKPIPGGEALTALRTKLSAVKFKREDDGSLHAYVDVAPKKTEGAAAEKRARTELHEWHPSMAKHTVDELPLPPLETHPNFIAPPGWLEERQTEVLNESKNVEIGLPLEYRTQPLCVARCSRGGKTRTLNELAHRLKKAGMPVIFVTFNSWCTLGVQSPEQRNPLQALLIRMAFLASFDEADWTPENFVTFRSNYHVSLASIWAWLGEETPCTLIIDEMNNAVKLREKCEEGDALGEFLRGTFLMRANRTLIFSSHIATLVTDFHSFVEASGFRGVLVKMLPKIYSLSVARETFGMAFTVQKLLYYGLIPALVHTRNRQPSWSVEEKGEFTNDVIRDLFRSFFTGQVHLVHPKLLKFMDTIAEKQVVWIMSHMHTVFGALALDLGGFAMGNQLNDLCELIQNFVDSKSESGDGFEFLFACAFLLRVGCSYPCEPFFSPSFATQQWSFSYNRYMKLARGATEFYKLKTWAELEDVILAPTLEEVTFPHVAYYLPLHARFDKYDGFARMYATPSDYVTLAFQLKRGKETPNKNADEPGLKAFLVRGWPSSMEKEIRGWRFVSGAELDPFFGESGKQWLPEHLDALTAP